jgi:hypothetical protein
MGDVIICITAKNAAGTAIGSPEATTNAAAMLNSFLLMARAPQGGLASGQQGCCDRWSFNCRRDRLHIVVGLRVRPHGFAASGSFIM